MTGRAVYFDCFAGIAGDMVLGALMDAGVSLETIVEPLQKLPIGAFEIEPQRVERGGISAVHVKVRGANDGVLRTYRSVRAMLEEADLPPRAKTTALTAYRKLAEAEARVHGRDVEHVAFHELGDIDTIVDIVGAAVALDALGITTAYASPVATGMGMMRTEHGMMPIPGPAVVELLRGAPVYSGGIPTELVTPTGAAILATTVEQFGELPAMRVAETGYGAGTRTLDIPNVLRVIVGELAGAGSGPQTAVVLETNIDDMNPEIYEYVLERLFSAGAQDAWITPILMKKGRPAATLSVLCPQASESAVRSVLFTETTTIGVRRRIVEKWALDRETITVEVNGRPIRVKVARDGGRIAGVAPEYADCAEVARATGRPLKDVYADALTRGRALAGA